jgi:hypothetical protein
MRFMNYWDIERARDTYRGHPVLGPATLTLSNLAEWTDRNSDGWAYWPKPCRSAEKLMELIEKDIFDTVREDATPEAYKAALRPIKAFRTRQGADFQIVEVSS